MTDVVSLHRSLDQELVALLRGASLECLVCGEFVMHAREGAVFCPESGSLAAENPVERWSDSSIDTGSAG